MTIIVRDLGIGSRLVDYTEAWDLQREVHAGVSTGERAPEVLLLEHHPVYTAGHRTLPEERPVDGTPVIDVDRGGKITWHGPGQLVGYPIVPLPGRVKSVDYVRRVEEAVIRGLRSFGLDAGRISGRTGAWVADEAGERKLAAIGIRVAKRTTMHGFAINVQPDLAWFDRIVPCGIADAQVTSVAAELGRDVSVAEMRDAVVPHVETLLADFKDYVATPDVAGPRPDPMAPKAAGDVPRLSVPIATPATAGAAR
jgi:lipoyl(octanoyl) transferase